MGPQREQGTDGGLELVLKAEGPGVTPSLRATPLRVTNHLTMRERVRRKSIGMTRNGQGEGTGNVRVGRELAEIGKRRIWQAMWVTGSIRFDN